MKNKLSANKVREILEDNGVYLDDLCKSKGVYIARNSFYFTGGKTSALLRAQIASVPNTEVLDDGEVWKSFRPGASIAQSSHWYVTFNFKERVIK